MPKIKCPCGNIINLGEIPNKNEWLFMSDLDFDKTGPTINSDELYNKFKRFYKCSECERLLVFWNDNPDEITVYSKD